MNCKETRELLPAHVDHELGVREAIDIDTHLQGCPACQAEYAQQTAARAAVKKHATYFAAPRRCRAPYPAWVTHASSASATNLELDACRCGAGDRGGDRLESGSISSVAHGDG